MAPHRRLPERILRPQLSPAVDGFFGAEGCAWRGPMPRWRGLTLTCG
jgi:hypothetical protein